MWVRFRVPVPAGSGPLAIRSPLESSVALPAEIWVDGRQAGSIGKFPPQPYARIVPVTTVFDLPSGSVTAGQTAGKTAIVAWRVWYPPALRLRPQTSGFRFEIGSRETLRAEERDAIAEDRLSRAPDAVAYAGFLLLGIALLAVWRLARGSHELFVFGIFLLGSGLWAIWCRLVPPVFRPDWSWQTQIFGDYLLQWLVFGVALSEFQRAVYGLKRRVPVRLIQAVSGVGYILGFLIYAAPASGRWVVFAATGWSVALGTVVSAATLLAAIQIRRSPQAREIAFAAIVWSAVSVLSGGWQTPYTGPQIPEAFELFGHRIVPYLFHVHLFQNGGATATAPDLANTLFVGAVALLLLRRAWKTWLRARELDGEFEAAQLMQRSLVPPAAGVTGFDVASVYLPAREVGGDFFWTIPEADGSLLLVAGDVSGKGLKAAMTVATLGGALRNESSRRPAKVLARLNSVLLGHGGEGFTTCCAALFQTDGYLIIANAGHVPPYRNGQEMNLESGLPLGLVAEPDYAEVVTELAPGDAVTFVSDGVVEARNADGELYGFERMCALSTESAAQIAETAQAFGQEDDISVITVQRCAVAARAA